MYKLANLVAKTIAAGLVIAFLATFFVASASTPCGKMDETPSFERPVVMNGLIVNMNAE